MIGFSITTWCIAVIMLCLGISLLKGNYTFVHGKVFDRTKDKAGYAKQLGKPVLLLAAGIAISGVIAVVLPPGVSYAGRDNFPVTGGSSNDWSVL